MSSGPIRVTLVHGTRAPDAAWTRPGSAMWAGLEAAGLECDTFVWSGRNSHAARAQAAQELAAHLRDGEGPGVTRAVVAHSHGGNVAAHAVWRLLPGTSRVPVVALATPFLFATRRRVEPAVIAAAVVAVLVLTLLAPFAVWAVVVEDTWSASRVVLLLLCVLLVPPALVHLVSVVAWRRAHGHLRSEDDRHAMVDRIQVPSCDDSLLVVRAPDDEAGVGLALVQLAGLFSTRLLAIARPAVWQRLVAALFVVAAAVGLVSGREASDAAVLGAAVAVSGGVLLAYTLVAVPTIVGVVLHGLDGPTSWFFANVTAEATPPGVHRVVQRALGTLPPKPPPETRGAKLRAWLVPWAPLAHSSLYDDPDVVRAVVAHLTSR